MRKSVDRIRNRIKVLLMEAGISDPLREFSDLEFETTTYCNRKCVYCPNFKHERQGDQDGRYMKETTFDKLLKDLEAINYQGLIAPHFYGEPLTDPRLVDWIRRIKEILPRARVRVVTNGDFLDRKKYEMLRNAGMDYMEISKHSPQLSQGAIDLLGFLGENKIVAIKDFYDDYLKNQQMLNTRGGEIKLKDKKQHPLACIYATYPVISTFGDVVLCCNDYHGRHVFGNINKRSLSDIWQDPKNIAVRHKIYKGIFDLPICQDCWV